MNVSYYTDYITNSYIIKDAMSIPDNKPAIGEILSTYFTVIPKSYRLSEGKALADAELKIMVLYLAEGEQDIHFAKCLLPFSNTLELEDDLGADGKCCIQYQISDFDVQQAEDSDGEIRNIEYEVSVDISLDGYCNKNISVVKDAYSTRTKLKLDKPSADDIATTIVHDNVSQFSLKDLAIVSADNPEVKEIFDVITNPVIYNCRCDNNNAIIEGMIESNILYATNQPGQPLFCYKYETPFKHIVELDENVSNMRCDAWAQVFDCEYLVASWSEVELRFNVEIGIMVLDNKPILDITTDVNEDGPIDEKRSMVNSSIVMYFCQPLDTLWSIAKKYGTTVDKIMLANDLEDNEMLMPGQQLIISRG